MNFARTPVIPLSYSEKHKAVPKELMVDYETGNIYVVSSKDKSIIFDITSQIKEKIDSLDGGKIDIVIDGLGKISLSDILAQLNNQIKDSVEIIDDDQDVSYVGQESVPDNKSIEFKGRNLQIKGFEQAPNLSIMRKKDGLLEWVDVDDLMKIFSGDYQIDNKGNIIPPSNPHDGKILYCYNVEPLNNKIFLRGSKRQKSYYISQDCTIILPNTLDERSEIEWYVVTNSFAPKFKFTQNIIWRNDAIQLITNGHHIYNFKTYDYGQTWLGELIIYDGNKSAHGMDMSYLNDHYYNKDQINKNYYSKSNMDKKYITNDILNNNYYSKNDVNNKFFNKTEIKEILSWKGTAKILLTNGGDKK